MGCGKSTAEHPMTAEERKADFEKKKAERDAAKKASADQKAFNERVRKEEEAKKKAETTAAKKAAADQKAFND